MRKPTPLSALPPRAAHRTAWKRPVASAIATACLFGLGTLAACAAPLAPGAKGEQPAPAWQSVSGKHTGSGVVMRYAVPDKMAVGETVTVRLQFSGVSAADGATIEVRDPAARTTLLTLSLAPGEQRVVDLPYTGRADGMQFIDVATTQAGRLTVQSVPLRVGSGELKLKPEGQRRTTASGETVISLPAASPPAPAASR